MKFRKKPVVIEAFRLGVDSIPDWFMDQVSEGRIVLFGVYGQSLDGAAITTLEGIMEARRGDMIIRGIKGELYPCKADIFQETYEAV